MKKTFGYECDVIRRNRKGKKARNVSCLSMKSAARKKLLVSHGSRLVALGDSCHDQGF